MSIIEAKGLELSYGKQKVLDNIDLTIQSNTITALIGPNGAGKSSAFRILAGLVKPEKGFVFIDRYKLPHIGELRHICGYLLESPDFYPYLSAKQNLELLIRLTRSSTPASELLETVGLTSDADKKVQNFSRGMKQRLGIAQLLIDKPEFLILDEPFNGLDPEVKEDILHLLFRLKESGKGIIISTHQLEDIESIADDFILLNKGKIFLTGKMRTHSSSSQNVILHFSENLPETLKLSVPCNIKEHMLQTMATIQETQDLLKEVISLGYVPFKISRSSLLHDTYMQIAK